jgi:carbon-monoxide dehydrogenase catalytic subunit
MSKLEDVRSVDPAARVMLAVADREGYETVWDRLKQQQPQCRMGQTGVCCRICSMGPCRINPSGKKPDRGVCGADADTIVARNLIRMIAAGASSHSDHGRKPAILLREIAAGHNADYGIKDPEKLLAVAARLGIAVEGLSLLEVAGEVAEVALECFGKQDGEPIRFLQRYMPARRQERFQKLETAIAAATGRRPGFLPRSIDREPVDVLHRTTFGTDHDPLSLLIQGVRCALADGWGGSMIATELQDILFGTPRAKEAQANLGVIDADYVNILVHGHEPIFSEKLIDCSLGEEMQAVAREHGAKGVKVIGMCCTVNEVLMRKGVAVAGNHLHQELAVMTGAIEAVVVDVQCILPSMVNLTRCFHTRFITTSDQAMFPGAIHIQYDEQNARRVSEEVVRTAIAAFSDRNPAKVYIPQEVMEARVGYGVEELSRHLGGDLQPLAEALADGTIRGIVGIVGCNNPKITQDYLHVGLARELIREGVLVVGTGCSAIAVAKAGLMGLEVADQAADGLRDFCRRHNLPPVLHMGSCVDCSRLLVLFSDLAERLDLDVSELPVVGSAPEWTTEKALTIGTYFAASGVPVHLGHMPPIAGSSTVTRILTEDLRGLLGGYFFVEGELLPATAAILAVLDERRVQFLSKEEDRPANLAS